MNDGGVCTKCGEKGATGAPCARCGGTVIRFDLDAMKSSLGGAAPVLGGAPSRPGGPSVTADRFEVLQEIQGGMNAPFSVVADDRGRLFVLDTDGGEGYRVLLFGADGRFARVVAAFSPGAGGLSAPHGVALGSAGRIYIPDAGNNRIVRLAESGEALPSIAPPEGDEWALNYPKDVDADPKGRLYLADSFNNRILRCDAEGTFDLALGINRDLDDDGCRDAGSEEGEFDEPAGVTADASGRIYVADTNNHRVQIFEADGTFEMALGTEGDGPGEFSFPSDVRVDDDGYLCVADASNTRVQRFNRAGALVSTFALPGAEGGSNAVGDVDVLPGAIVLVPYPEKKTIVKGRLIELRAKGDAS